MCRFSFAPAFRLAGNQPEATLKDWSCHAGPMVRIPVPFSGESATNCSGRGPSMEPCRRLTGGTVMPTIACHMQLLHPGENTRARRRVCCTVEGAGYSIVGGERLDWEDKDVFTVPTWPFYEHVNTGDRPAFLFSFSDAPVMKALSLYRDETRS